MGTQQGFDRSIYDVITQFRVNYYRKVLKSSRNGEESLSTDESFCVDAIAVLGRPTIGEFAHFVQISPQSAAYKVNNLVRKGYISRTRGSDDKREFYLETTEKYARRREAVDDFLSAMSVELHKRFSDKDIETAQEMLKVAADSLGQDNSARPS